MTNFTDHEFWESIIVKKKLSKTSICRMACYTTILSNQITHTKTKYKTQKNIDQFPPRHILDLSKSWNENEKRKLKL